MKQLSWLHWFLAAALVIAGGAVLVFADGDEVRKEVKVNINGDVESLGLEDLADGETRTFDAGEHSVTVTRNGDDLSVLLDGEELAGLDITGSGSKSMIWVSEDGDLHPHGEGSPHRVMVFKGDGEGDAEYRTITVHAECDEDPEDCDKEIDIDIEIESIDEMIASGDAHVIHGGSDAHAVFVGEGDGSHPVMIKTMNMHEGMVRYKCEETGSTLLVSEEDAISDTYICPATGCVMERVTEPQVKVIKIRQTVEIEDNDE